MANELNRILTGLDGIKTALASDSYMIEVTGLRERTLEVLITGQPGACPECLIPERTMAALIRTQVPSDIALDKITVNIANALDGESPTEPTPVGTTREMK